MRRKHEDHFASLLAKLSLFVTRLKVFNLKSRDNICKICCQISPRLKEIYLDLCERICINNGSCGQIERLDFCYVVSITIEQTLHYVLFSRILI